MNRLRVDVQSREGVQSRVDEQSRVDVQRREGVQSRVYIYRVQ